MINKTIFSSTREKQTGLCYITWFSGVVNCIFAQNECNLIFMCPLKCPINRQRLEKADIKSISVAIIVMQGITISGTLLIKCAQ